MKILKSKDEILRDVAPWEGINDLSYYLNNPMFKGHEGENIYSDFLYPFRKAAGTLHKHVKIYKLIDEIINLSQDYHRCESKTSRDMISRRLEETVKELKSFIVFDMRVSMRDQGKHE